MFTSKSELFLRLQSITRVDRRPLTDLPRGARIALAGLMAIGGSLVADAILVAMGTASFHPPASFGKFAFATYAALTIVGIVGATAFWAAVVRLTSEPRWVLRRAAVAVTLVLLVPDVLLLPKDSTGGVLTLMAMHVAIAVITTLALLKIAPANGPARIAPDTRRAIRV